MHTKENGDGLRAQHLAMPVAMSTASNKMNKATIVLSDSESELSK